MEREERKERGREEVKERKKEGQEEPCQSNTCLLPSCVFISTLN